MESWKLVSGLSLCALLAYYLYFYFKRYQARNGLLFDPLIARFTSLKESGEDAEAIELVNRLINAPAKQNLWFWYYQRYRYYLNQGLYQEALADLNASLQLNAHKAELFLAQVELLFQIEDDEAMYRHSADLLKAWPQSMLTRVLCTIAAAKQEHISEAVEHFNVAEKMLNDPNGRDEDVDRSLLLFYYGYATLLMGKTEEAQSYFERSLNINPENSDALFGLALMEYQRGDANSAFITVQRAIINNQRNTKALNLMGELYLQLNKPNEAREQFRLSAKWGNLPAQKRLENGGLHTF